jgi:Ca2+/H+ antiporter, TMEM165/GDT1 family
MTAFIASLIFVALAEMGDKTQLLAMAFAARYKVSQVLLAVFSATLLNHALAVFVGGLLVKLIPLYVISLIAGASFILFGLWTLRGDALNGEDKKFSKRGPVATIAIAFFFAEMGDKTQLATISLAVKYRNYFGVLAGTTTGMLIADAFGILVGVVMKKHISGKAIKWSSALVFIVYGIVSIFNILIGRV